MGLLDNQVAIVAGAGAGVRQNHRPGICPGRRGGHALLEINAETVKAVEAEIHASGGEARAYRWTSPTMTLMPLRWRISCPGKAKLMSSFIMPPLQFMAQFSRIH